MHPSAPAPRRRLLSRIGLGRFGNKNGRRRPGTARMGTARPPRTRKQKILWALKWGAIGGLACTALVAATVAMLFWIWGRDPNLPSISKLADYRPAQVSRVLSHDGKVVGEIYTKRRTYVPFERIPKVMVQAVVSAEDADFYHHEGIDYTGMIRAFFVDLKEGGKVQGASTITQQVVKNLLLTRQRSIKRKVQEIILSRRLEHSLTKDEILTTYLNEINFGHGRYGVEEAARFYFGKDIDKVNVGEAAMLAGLPQSPARLSPIEPRNRERAKRRQIYVLEQMVRNGYLKPAEAKKWIDAPIQIVSNPYPSLGDAPEWVDVARAALVERYGADQVDKAGVNVMTTLDLHAEKVARQALRAGLRAYDQRKKYGVPITHLKDAKVDLELARLARHLPRGGPVVGEEYRAVVRSVSDVENSMVVDLGKWKGEVALGGRGDDRFNPDGKKASERFKPGDLIRVMVPHASKDKDKAKDKDEDKGETDGDDDEAGDTGDSDSDAKSGAQAGGSGLPAVNLASGPEGAVVVIDPRNRHVLAVVGGYHFRAGDFNRATMAKRQAGSTFKPFVYAAAIDSGEKTAASLVNDAPEVYSLGTDLWKPENYEKGEFRGPVRLRLALAHSINTVAIRTIYDIGPQRVAQLARAMGVQSQLPETLSLALGSGDVSPLELTNAFATFAAGGKTAPPQVLERVGKELIHSPAPTQALRPEVAYILIDMMRSVITEGTGTRASRLKLDVVGKTGTSNKVRDAWFMGMTPDLVVGVWVGFDDFKRQLGRGEQGGVTALPVFVDVMKQLARSGERFQMPAGVVSVRIDKATGLLAPEGAPDDSSYDEVFLAGTAPTEVAPRPGEATADTFVQDQYDDVYGDGQDGGSGAGAATGTGTGTGGGAAPAGGKPAGSGAGGRAPPGAPRKNASGAAPSAVAHPPAEGGAAP